MEVPIRWGITRDTPQPGTTTPTATSGACLLSFRLPTQSVNACRSDTNERGTIPGSSPFPDRPIRPEELRALPRLLLAHPPHHSPHPSRSRARLPGAPVGSPPGCRTIGFPHILQQVLLSGLHVVVHPETHLQDSEVRRRQRDLQTRRGNATGPSGQCGATVKSYASAICAMQRVSEMPPVCATSGWRMSTV